VYTKGALFVNNILHVDPEDLFNQAEDGQGHHYSAPALCTPHRG